MIKSDLQLRRTLKSIEDFRANLDATATIKDEAEREIAASGYRAMLQRLLHEKSRYENAKRGLVYVPRVLSILQLCPYLVDIRIALGWTQELLASKMGVTRQAVNKWEEHAYQDVSVSTLQRLVDVMGLHAHLQLTHAGVRLEDSATENDPPELEAAIC